MTPLKKFKPEVVRYVQNNLRTAYAFPNVIAQELKEKGYYSPTTYIKDIAGSVRTIVKLLNEAKVQPIRSKVVGKKGHVLIIDDPYSDHSGHGMS